MIKIVDIDNYALFDYNPYLERGSEVDKPKKLKYQIGQVVYLKHTNAIGVVLGCIDMVGEELRTDMDGMVCFDDLRPVKKADFKIKDVRFIPRLKSEVIDNKVVSYDKKTRHTTVIDISKKAIQKKAQEIYEAEGQSAVFDYANELGVDYKYCSPCETSSPSVDFECLVCGSPTEYLLNVRIEGTETYIFAPDSQKKWLQEKNLVHYEGAKDYFCESKDVDAIKKLI